MEDQLKPKRTKYNTVIRHSLIVDKKSAYQRETSRTKNNDLEVVNDLDTGKLSNKAVNKMKQLFLNGIDPLTMQPFSEAHEKFETIKTRRMKNKIRVPKIQLNTSNANADDFQFKTVNMDNIRNKDLSQTNEQLASTKIHEESKNVSVVNSIRRNTVLPNVKFPIIGRSNSQLRLSKGAVSQIRFERENGKNRSQASLSNSHSQNLIYNNFKKELAGELSLFESDHEPKGSIAPKSVIMKGRESKFRK